MSLGKFIDEEDKYEKMKEAVELIRENSVDELMDDDLQDHLMDDLIETTTIKLMTEREEIDYVTCRFPACYAKSLQILRYIIDSMQLKTSQRHPFISRNLELVQFPVEVDMYEALGAKGLLPTLTSRLGESGQEYDLLMERDLKHLANWSDKDEDVWLEAM